MKTFKYIGGEFWYNDTFMNSNTKPSKGYFLGGGQSSLYVILEYLKQQNINKVLLPSYLCPTILNVIDTQSFEYEFYEIKNDFSIDINNILEKVDSFPAIYFINYFGISLNKMERDFFKKIRQNGIIVIEDNVQTLDEDLIGSFTFTSYRKLIPYSGSTLYSTYNLSSIINKLSVNQAYYSSIRQARKLKTQFITKEEGQEEDYLRKFKESEEFYTSTFFIGDSIEREHINRLDFKAMAEIRQRNYQYLLDKLNHNKSVKPIIKSLNNTTPLGMPVYVDPDKRNYLRVELQKKNIFLPIHWDLIHDERVTSENAKDISKRILTLVIDQRYSIEDMDTLVTEIKNCLGD